MSDNRITTLEQFESEAVTAWKTANTFYEFMDLSQFFDYIAWVALTVEIHDDAHFLAGLAFHRATVY